MYLCMVICESAQYHRVVHIYIARRARRLRYIVYVITALPYIHTIYIHNTVHTIYCTSYVHTHTHISHNTYIWHVYISHKTYTS